MKTGSDNVLTLVKRLHTFFLFWPVAAIRLCVAGWIVFVFKAILLSLLSLKALSLQYAYILHCERIPVSEILILRER